MDRDVLYQNINDKIIFLDREQRLSLLKTLINSGVKVFSHPDGTRVKLSSLDDKMLATIESFIDSKIKYNENKNKN